MRWPSRFLGEAHCGAVVGDDSLELDAVLVEKREF